MKKRLLLIICSIVFMGRGVSGQEAKVLMGKEEMEDFAEVINELVLAERYEEAIRLYDANREVVNPKLLCRQDRGWWKETASELEEKLALFNGNRDKIKEAWAEYEGYRYRRSWDIVKGMRCDSSNAYRESVEELRVIRDSLEGKRAMMEMIEREMGDYVAKFKAKRYDELFPLLGTEHLLGYVPEGNMKQMTEMVNKLNEMIETDPIGLVMNGTLKDRNLIMSICETDMSRLLFAMRLDVIHYYNMLFDTEAQIARYKASEEYQAKMEELRQVREGLLKRVHCQAVKVEMGSYNREDGCFYVMIGSNKGTNLTYFNYATAAPQKAVGKRFEEVVHETLNVKSFTDKSQLRYQNGDKFLQHFLVVPMDEESALRYENGKCTLLVCFVPAGAKEYQFKGAEFYTVKKAYDVFDVKAYFPYSERCRVMLFSEDGELVYER